MASGFRYLPDQSESRALSSANPTASPSLQSVLPQYQKALDKVSNDPESFLDLLLIRDKVEDVRRHDKDTTPQSVETLVRLDEQLREKTAPIYISSLARWRKSLQPALNLWWWHLDEAAEKRGKDKDFLWETLAVTVFILTVPLATDVIRRLWTHAPDNAAIVSTLLILLITASPFTKNGRELMQLVLRRFSRVPTRRHAEIMAITAFVAFLLVAGLRFVYLPQLAKVYNDQGVAAFEQGQLTVAREKLQRAIAINKDLATSYFNLAAEYEKIARYEDAIHLYDQALEQNLEFAPAYSNLGRLYLQQGEFEKARRLLLAGVAVLEKAPQPKTQEERQTTLVTRYRLLTHLGQAYFEENQFALATQSLEEAIAIEQSGEMEAAILSARPHYFQALTYEQLQRPKEEIITQWETALAYLTSEDPANWQTTITDRLRALR